MRAFVVLCLAALAVADVSELASNGYNYQAPSGGFGGGSGGSGGDFGGSGLESSLSGGSFGPGGAGGSFGGSDDGFGLGGAGGAGDGFGAFGPGGGAGGAEEGPSVSKRFFSVTAQDDGSDDDEHDDSSSSAGGHRTVDVVFANNPNTASLKSALRAVSKFAGDHETAVYVLSQQLGAKQLADAIRSSGIKPSKPRVHFVKYRTPEEAARAQQQIRSQYDRLGGSTEDGGHESAPVQSFGGRRGHGYGNRYGQGNGHGNGFGHGSGLGHHGHGHGSGPSYGGRGSGFRYGYGGSPSGHGSVGLSNRYLPPRY